jgi:hypothetical protein
MAKKAKKMDRKLVAGRQRYEVDYESRKDRQIAHVSQEGGEARRQQPQEGAEGFMPLV